ncbi:hypothetical protein ZWY2020_032859 [Hordeum vulgare]|nr:hypothetical protein ZWY2020_032859 [Hordeum vulgare]
MLKLDAVHYVLKELVRKCKGKYLVEQIKEVINTPGHGAVAPGLIPFMVSAQSGVVATVKYFHDHAGDDKGRTDLHHAVAAGCCKDKTLKILFEQPTKAFSKCPSPKTRSAIKNASIFTYVALMLIIFSSFISSLKQREICVSFVPAAEAVDHSWRDWGVDGDWIWEDDGAKPATTTSSRVVAVVDDPVRLAFGSAVPTSAPCSVRSRFSSRSRATPLLTHRKHRSATRLPAACGSAPDPAALPVAPPCASTAPPSAASRQDQFFRLQDMSVVHEFEWDEHILLDAIREVKKYQDKRNEGKLKFHIGGCLPMLPVIYMDHIDIPRGCIVDHSIDYSLPRACFVKELDFNAVIVVDTMEDGFGKRLFSSTTPYATTKFLSYIEQVAQLPNIASVSAIENPVNRDADGAEQPTESDTNEADGRARNVHEPPPKNMGDGDDVCGSLEDWLHPLPTFEDLELPPHMRAIFNKHKDIHAAELKGALSSFGSLLEGIYRKRIGLMLSEALKAGFRSDEAKHECPDVTVDVPAAPAPATCNTTASDSSHSNEATADYRTPMQLQDSDYVSILEKPCCNLIENFKTLVRERNPWKHDLDKFERFNPSGYPKQSTTFDCGLFVILYMENLTAKGLKPFSTDTTSLLNFRKYIAAKLFKHHKTHSFRRSLKLKKS